MPRAALMTAPGRPIEVRELPEPRLEPGGIVLETLFSEICGTDVHLLHGRLEGVPYPIIPGHVSVGRVVEVGGPVAGGGLLDIDGNAVESGAVVTFLDVHETCHSCYQCLVAKNPTRCPSRKVYGVTYAASEGLLGGWSERIYLKPGVRVLVLPEGVTPERLIAGGCGLPTALHAVDRAEIRLGDVVAVQGCGPVGLNAAVLARLSGAGGVIVVDPVERRLEAALALGADEAVRVDPGDPGRHVERVLELTQGRGADVTIEATGVPSAVPQGTAMTRDGGRYVIVGHYTDTGEVALNPHTEINRKHLEIRGTWGLGFDHFYRMLRLLARHGDAVGWERMISRAYGLEEMNEALADVEAGRVVKALVAPNGTPG